MVSNLDKDPPRMNRQVAGGSRRSIPARSGARPSCPLDPSHFEIGSRATGLESRRRAGRYWNAWNGDPFRLSEVRISSIEPRYLGLPLRPQLSVGLE
jgi:hypothetical protein